MSTPRDDSVYLAHLKDAVFCITSYLDGINEAQFFESRLLQDAVIRQLEIIGEASKHLSRAFRASRPTVPWQDIIGMRSKLAHDYMHVNLQAVWDTARMDIPALERELFRA